MKPVPIGLPRQQWPFVKDYDDWPFHPGHNPNSLDKRRLREAGLSPAHDALCDLLHSLTKELARLTRSRVAQRQESALEPSGMKKPYQRH